MTPIDDGKVILNKYGYYELANKPSLSELDEYYSKKYYQENKATYNASYSEAELQYTSNKIGQKYKLLQPLLNPGSGFSLLDVGCGEGFALKYFKEMNWKVKGLDYSSFGCAGHNPDCVENITTGDIYKNLAELEKSGAKFDLIWLDNVLEHVLDPLGLLRSCRNLSKPKSVLMIEVPNDFSALQLSVYKEKMIDRPFWIIEPDHISYFNKEGLTNLCAAAGWNTRKVISDFPIDFNLANDKSNYIADKTNGKSAHKQRVFIENMMHAISDDKTNAFYEALADLGLGRLLTSISTNY